MLCHATLLHTIPALSHFSGVCIQCQHVSYSSQESLILSHQHPSSIWRCHLPSDSLPLRKSMLCDMYGVISNLIYSGTTWRWDFWFPTLIGLFWSLHQLAHFSAIALPRLQLQKAHPMNALERLQFKHQYLSKTFFFAFELSRGYSISSLLDNVCQPMTKIYNIQCNMIISECKK